MCTRIKKGKAAGFMLFAMTNLVFAVDLGISWRGCRVNDPFRPQQLRKTDQIFNPIHREKLLFLQDGNNACRHPSLLDMLKFNSICGGVSLFVVASLTGCAQTPSVPSTNYEQVLIGDWEAVATEIRFTSEAHTPNNDRTINVSEGEWETHFNRTPPRMHYAADHSYQSMYVSLVDFEGRQSSDTISQHGTWLVKGDTLTILEPSLSVPETKFKLKLIQDRLELSATMDMDGDGDVDDSYWLVQKRRK